MLEIKVNIEATAPDLAAAIEKLAEAISGHPGTTSNLVISPEKAVGIPVDVIPVVKNDSQDVSATAENAPAAQTNVQSAGTQIAAGQTPAEQQAQQQFMNPPAAAAAPVIDLDVISRAGAALIDQGRTNEILALLKQFGVPAVNLLDQSQYPAFAEGLRALGASI